MALHKEKVVREGVRQSLGACRGFEGYGLQPVHHPTHPNLKDRVRGASRVQSSAFAEHGLWPAPLKPNRGQISFRNPFQVFA